MPFFHKQITPLKNFGFTILELLIVVAIIAILAGLVVSTSGYINTKVARARASGELESLAMALEAYKSDMGEYPRWSHGSPTGTANPGNTPTGGTNILVLALAPPGNDANMYNPSGKKYMDFSSGMLTNTANNSDKPILDPFGASYGYVCPAVNNPTNYYDLWSTAGKATNSNSWIKNW